MQIAFLPPPVAVDPTPAPATPDAASAASPFDELLAANVAPEAAAEVATPAAVDDDATPAAAPDPEMALEGMAAALVMLLPSPRPGLAPEVEPAPDIEPVPASAPADGVPPPAAGEGDFPAITPRARGTGAATSPAAAFAPAAAATADPTGTPVAGVADSPVPPRHPSGIETATAPASAEQAPTLPSEITPTQPPTTRGVASPRRSVLDAGSSQGGAPESVVPALPTTEFVATPATAETVDFANLAPLSSPLASRAAASAAPVASENAARLAPAAAPVAASERAAAARSVATPANLQVAISAGERERPVGEAPAVSAYTAAAATPTLAQVLAERAASRAPAPSPLAATVAGTSAAAAPVAPAPTSAPTGGEAAPSVFAPAEIASAAAGVRSIPEKLAGARAKVGSPEETNGALPQERKFLAADSQRLEERETKAGTGIAKSAQTMPALSLANHPATAALDLSETPVVTPLGAAREMPVVVVRQPLSTESAGAAAAAAVQETVALAERLQEAGRHHVELRVQTAGDENLRVHLRWHDGVIETKFVTDTADLQQALSREWARVVPQLADKGLRFGEASFERRDQQPSDQSSQNAFTGGQQRQHPQNQGQTYQRAEERAFTLPSPTGTTPTAARRSAVTTVAGVSTPASLNIAEARGLRVWA